MSTFLDDIISRDAARVWLSSCAIIKLRGVAELDHLANHLPEIRLKTENLTLGGALFSNAAHLKFALRKLAYHQERAGCLCRLYPEYLFYNPQQEAEAGHFYIDEITYVEGNWVDAYFCTCTQCGTSFRVIEREYHYTWWKWVVTGDPDRRLG